MKWRCEVEHATELSALIISTLLILSAKYWLCSTRHRVSKCMGSESHVGSDTKSTEGNRITYPSHATKRTFLQLLNAVCKANWEVEHQKAYAQSQSAFVFKCVALRLLLQHFFCYKNNFKSPKKVRRTRGETQILVRVHHTWSKAAEAGGLRLFQADIIGGYCLKRLPSFLPHLLPAECSHSARTSVHAGKWWDRRVP